MSWISLGEPILYYNSQELASLLKVMEKWEKRVILKHKLRTHIKFFAFEKRNSKF